MGPCSGLPYLVCLSIIDFKKAIEFRIQRKSIFSNLWRYLFNDSLHSRIEELKDQRDSVELFCLLFSSSALSFSWAIARASSISSLSAFAWGNGRNRYRILSSASERAWSTTSFGWSDVEEAGSGSAAGGRFKSMSHRGQGFDELYSPEVPDTPTIRKGKTRSPKRMNTQAIK